MADIKISELERVQSLNNGDLVEVSQEDTYSETGYSSKSAKMTDLGEKVVNGIEYTSELDTSNKKIIGAINEIASYTPVYGNTASGAIATFDTSLALPLQDCTIAINAVQESGTPTPSSPKLISGFTGANIHVADDENPHVIDNVTAISWQSEAGTVYGGSLDVTTGVLTVDWFGVKPTDLTLDGYSTGSSSVCYRVNLVNNAISVSLISDKRGAKSNMSTENTAYFGVMRPNECDVNCFAITQAGNKIAIYDTDTTLTQAQFETKYSDMFIIYPLATPVTYQLTPTQISAIVGTNNIFTDTNGNTSVVYACSLKDYIDGQ